MRIDEQVNQCTSFLVLRTEVTGAWRFSPAGTAFFVGVNVGRDCWAKYAVTARHVIDGSRPHGPLWMRCVSQDGKKKKLFEYAQDAWWLHPTADVALAPLAIPLEDYDLKFLPVDLFATPEWMKEHDVGVGDRVVASGLFSQYLGSSRDAPLLRFGRIALVPDEPLRIPSQGPLPSMELSAVLAELGSWGGQSGSPVFVYFSVDRDLFAGEALRLQIPNPRLLGLLHGHYTVPQSIVENAGELGDARVPMNSGIAIVIPAATILEVIMSEPVLEHREHLTRILREEGLVD